MSKGYQLAFDLGHRSAYGREDFWVAPCNQEAITWIDRWPNWTSTGLVVWGDEASGKTHLGRVWQKASAALVLDMNERAPIPATTSTVFFDDIDAYIGNLDSETYLFHLYNQIKEKNGSFLMTSLKPPAQWLFALPDLKSRILSLPSAMLGRPDDALMMVVLAKMFSDRQVFVPEDVMQFIVARVERSFGALRKIVDAVDAEALSKKRPVTIPLVRSLILG